jgi:hypothetical protein
MIGDWRVALTTELNVAQYHNCRCDVVMCGERSACNIYLMASKMGSSPSLFTSSGFLRDRGNTGTVRTKFAQSYFTTNNPGASRIRLSGRGAVMIGVARWDIFSKKLSEIKSEF